MLDRYLRSYVEDLKWTLEEIDQGVLGRIVELFDHARKADRQILVIGNGGSASLASHLACDLGKGTVDFSNPDFQRFRVLSLTDNLALITAIGNDLSYEDVFAEQLRMVLRAGDLVVIISASGSSPNLVRAAEYARQSGATTIALLGFGGGRLGKMVDHPLVVSSRNYGISEDFHSSVQHVLTQYLRRALAGPPRPVVFLDRDGVINQRPGPDEYVENWNQFRFVDGVLPALATLSAHGYRLIVVTNQQGVGKDRMSADALRVVHERMTSALETAGVRLDGIFHCPHLEEDGCFCRKPRPGLIYRALNETDFLIDLERSVMIGDSERDIAAGRAVGLQTILLSAGGAASASSSSGATHVVRSVQDVVSLLVPISSQQSAISNSL